MQDNEHTEIHVAIMLDGPISDDAAKAAVRARGELFVAELRNELLHGAETYGSTAPKADAWGMGRAHVERVVHVTTAQRGAEDDDAGTVHVELALSEDEARAIACVRSPDVALDEVEPAGAQEVAEHLRGFVELACEEADPEYGRAAGDAR